MKSNIEPAVSFYCESAPLAEQYVAYGLQRALVPVLKGLSSAIQNVYIFPRDGYVLKSRILPEVRGKSIVANNLIAKLVARIESRYPSLALAIFSLVMRFAALPTRPRHIVAVIGANTQSLIRAQKFARSQAATILCYFVDEIDHPKASLSNLKNDSNALLDRFGTPRSDVRGFAITDELAALINRKHGFDTSGLPLPYVINETEKLAIDREIRCVNQVIYIGAINFLYKPSLVKIIEEIWRHNRDAVDPVILRLTVSRETAERQIGPLPDWIVCEPIPERLQMLREVAKSKAALMPVSFESEAKSMVSTSFPSKFLDYLAAARKIFVLAPEYSSVARYLSTIPEIKVAEEARDLSLFLSDDPRSLPGRFQPVLEKRHSSQAFATTVKDAIWKAHATSQ